MSKTRPAIGRDDFPKAWHFEFFDTDDFSSPPLLPGDFSGYVTCGDWIDDSTGEKEWGVSIYFHKSADAESALKKLNDLGWDAWIDTL